MSIISNEKIANKKAYQQYWAGKNARHVEIQDFFLNLASLCEEGQGYTAKELCTMAKTKLGIDIDSNEMAQNLICMHAKYGTSRYGLRIITKTGRRANKFVALLPDGTVDFNKVLSLGEVNTYYFVKQK